MNKQSLTVIGGGLAGCEAAWQAAQRNIKVNLYEMRPIIMSGVHKTSLLGELVCSNSFGSQLADRASGCLLNELERLKSIVVQCAQASALPSGGALAVDRECFATLLTKIIEGHPNINVIREEIKNITSDPTIIATGPLSSPAISRAITDLTGKDQLFFFDAVAPIVSYESINMNIAFKASRYNRGVLEDGDYINCPFDKAQFECFVNELLSAERYPLKPFEEAINQGVDAGKGKYFEGCLPIEVLAARNPRALLFGPMRPIGLENPATGKRHYAIVQLRQDNQRATLYNLVGFQTNLIVTAQKRVLHLIPGLEEADIVRYGQMHRNSYILSPQLLDATMQFRQKKELFFAGQITGVEGYLGNIASGLLAGINTVRWIRGKELWILPQTTMMGALFDYITNASAHDFQPMKANFGLLPQLEDITKRGKRQRAGIFAKRADESLSAWMQICWEED